MKASNSIIAGALAGLMILAAFVSAVGADGGRPAGQNLNVDTAYTISGTETWDYVFVNAGGTLTIPSGATLSTKSILLQGGSFRATGGTVNVQETTLGLDSQIAGDCVEFNVSGGSTLTLAAPNGAAQLDTSQGGEAIVKVNASQIVSVSGGTIQCTGGNGASCGVNAWTTAPLSGYVSAGGRGYISLGGPDTPKVELGGGAKLITVGKDGGNAAHGKPGTGSTGGKGGGFSNGGMVSGYVGSGGDGSVEVLGQSAVIGNIEVTCTGGNGGKAGNGAAGSTTAGGTYYYYSGGGGAGGYGGGDGGTDYQNAGKSGTASENAGAGGYGLFTMTVLNATINGPKVTLKGGNGGLPGTGGNGGQNPSYMYYSAGAGGGGYGGGGGGSSYATGGSGSASGNVGSGGESNMTLNARSIVITGLTLSVTGGNGQNGATGGAGVCGGGGGGGYGGGGGGGAYNAGGNGGSNGNVGAGGNGTMTVVATDKLSVIGVDISLFGGTPGNGGTGGAGGNAGGSYYSGGGGGGGYGGGGGGGGYNYNGAAGSGQCSMNVGRGGETLARMWALNSLWVNTSSFNLTGGNGGNGGTAGAAGTGGGGGGGYSGSGGAGAMGTAGDGTVNVKVGDGGDAGIEFWCFGRASIPADFVKITQNGGVKGDGKTAKGGGVGGAGKGRVTAVGSAPRNVPRMIPLTLGPADGSLFNNIMPHLSWIKQLDAVIYPSTNDPIWNYEVAIANDTTFTSIKESAKDIASTDMEYVPEVLKGGHYFWRVRALYEGGKSPGWSENKNFSLNGAPIQLKNIPSLSFPEDTNVSHMVDLDLYFTDDLYPGLNTYSVVYEQDASKIHATVDGHWLNLFSMAKDWFGSKKVVVRATDYGGIPLDSNNFTTSVTPVNDAPFFKDIPTIEVTEDQTYRFDLSVYLDDVDSSLGQMRVNIISSYATLDGFNITFLYPRGIGTDSINISMSDGYITVYKVVGIAIASVNDVPVTLPMPGLTTNEDTKLTLDLTPFAMDEEDLPTQLVWRVENVPVELKRQHKREECADPRTVAQSERRGDHEAHSEGRRRDGSRGQPDREGGVRERPAVDIGRAECEVHGQGAPEARCQTVHIGC